MNKRLYSYKILKHKKGYYIVGRKFLRIFPMHFAWCEDYSGEYIREWKNKNSICFKFQKASMANNALLKFLEKDIVEVNISKEILNE